MLSDTVFELAAWQFMLACLPDLLFLPLTLGLGLIVAALQVLPATGPVLTLWTRLFAASFMLAFAGRLALLLLFGATGSYFAAYAGDAFAAPLALESLCTFLPAAVLLGPLLTGPERLGRRGQPAGSWLLAALLTLSMLWLAIALSWLENPVATTFEAWTFRLELDNLPALLDNPPVIGKFVHLLGTSGALAAATVLAISAWRMPGRSGAALAGSFRLAAVCGLASCLLLSLGDPTPQADNPVQQRKLALLAGKDADALQADVETHIRNGIAAYRQLQTIRDENRDPAVLADFARTRGDLGYALLLKRWTAHPEQANAAQIAEAARSALPAHPGLLRGCRWLMIAAGMISLLLFAAATVTSLRPAGPPAWLLRLAVRLAPLPWLASAAGWFLAVGGMQPWAVAGLLPDFLGVATLSAGETALALGATVFCVGCLLTLAALAVRNWPARYFPEDADES